MLRASGYDIYCLYAGDINIDRLLIGCIFRKLDKLALLGIYILRFEIIECDRHHVKKALLAFAAVNSCKYLSETFINDLFSDIYKSH